MGIKTLNFAALAVGLAFFAGPCTNLVQAKSRPDAVISAPIALQDLPKEGQDLSLIHI
jgi:hypothetical protein